MKIPSSQAVQSQNPKKNDAQCPLCFLYFPEKEILEHVNLHELENELNDKDIQAHKSQNNQAKQPNYSVNDQFKQSLNQFKYQWNQNPQVPKSQQASTNLIQQNPNKNIPGQVNQLKNSEISEQLKQYLQNKNQTTNNSRFQNYSNNLNNYEMNQQLDKFQKEDGGLTVEMLNNLKTYQYQQTQSSELCSICSETMKDFETVRELPCSHIFHQHCVDEWILKSPFCPIDNSDLRKKI